MSWKGSPIPMYQSMWYAPEMGRGTAGPCIGTICYLSVLTWSRMRITHTWQELNTQAPQLQHHLWTVDLLMQSCLGWPHQSQQATCPRLIWINLLHSDMTHIQPITTPMEVPELCIAGRYQPTQYLGFMAWSVYLSSFHIMSVHHYHGKYGVNTLYLFHPMSARHHSLWH